MKTLTQRFARWRAWSLLTGLALVGLLAGETSGQDPSSLARRVSGTDLVAYVEFDGFDAHAREWKSSAAYKALNGTSLGALLEDLAAQGIDRARKAKGPNEPTGAQVVQMIEKVLKKGFVFAVNGKTPSEMAPTVIIRGGTDPELAPLTRNMGQGQAKTEMRGSRKLTTFGNLPVSDALIEDKGDLVSTTVRNVEQTLASLDGKGLTVASNPVYVELSKPDGTFRPIALAFVEARSFGPLPPQASALGLDGLKRIDYRWGTRDGALYSVFRLLAPSPRKGLLALFDGPTFDKSTLPPFPPNLSDFSAVSLSPQQVYEKLMATVRQAVPNGDQQVAAIEQMAEQVLGVKLKQDVLARLGPKWSFYLTANEAAGSLPVNVVALTELTEPAKLAGALDKVLQAANQQIKMSGGPNAGQKPVPQFQKLSGGALGFEMVFPNGTLPPGPMAALKPTILVGKKYLAIGTTGRVASSALGVAEGNTGRWKPDAAYTKIFDTLPKGLVFLSVSDPRQSLPKLIQSLPQMVAQANMVLAGAADGQAAPIQVDAKKLPKSADLAANLFPAYIAMSTDAKGISVITREALPSVGNPGTTAVAVALLLPAVQAAREAARRTQCVNNLKQMGLAMHNTHSVNNAFPGNIVDKQGKPLLSWRVAILPFLEQQELYNQFKLDEPWDSPNNKPLMALMPKVFECPSHPSPEPGMTFYQGFSGPGAFFADPKKPTALAMMTDGSSNTIAVVEAKTPVAWTKPDDLPFDPKGNVPLFGAGSNHTGGFNALFADGAVRFLKNSINPEIFKALITINGGEVINADAY